MCASRSFGYGVGTVVIFRLSCLPWWATATVSNRPSAVATQNRSPTKLARAGHIPPG
jgi:hypothetical protein